MPLHDWTRVDAGLFKDFRSSWICEISRALNGGVLSDAYYALLAPGALTVDEIVAAPGTVPFREPWLEESPVDEMDFYRRRKSHVVIRRAGDHVAVAVVDILSAGDEANRGAVRSFVDRISGLMRRNVHALICDVLPPDAADPQGIHEAIWKEIDEAPFELPADKPLTVVAYRASPMKTAYVEPVAVGDELPALPPGPHFQVTSRHCSNRHSASEVRKLSSRALRLPTTPPNWPFRISARC